MGQTGVWSRDVENVSQVSSIALNYLETLEENSFIGFIEEGDEVCCLTRDN